MIFNEIKSRVNTSLGLVEEMHPLHPLPCVRAWSHYTSIKMAWSESFGMQKLHDIIQI